MRWASRIGGRVKLRDLHILLAVVEWRSISKAARHLAISHPVVSKSISDIEHTLGVRLLDRSPRGVEPTTYGRALLDCGTAVFDELQQCMKRIELLSDPTAGELRIGSTEPLMAGLVPAIIERLTSLYPRIVFHAMQGDIPLLERALRERSVDVVVGRTLHPTLDDDFDSEVLFDERLLVVAGKQSRWSHRRKINLAELMDEPWIIIPFDSIPGALVADAFRASGMDVPRASVLTHSIPLRNSLLAGGRFLSVFASSMLHFSANHLSVKVLPVALPIKSRPVGVTTLKNRTQSPLVHLFTECARELAKAIDGRPERHQK
jgi:DNA-binding transcriptional LysR family regulator